MNKKVLLPIEAKELPDELYIELKKKATFVGTNHQRASDFIVETVVLVGLRMMFSRYKDKTLYNYVDEMLNRLITTDYLLIKFPM